MAIVEAIVEAIRNAIIIAIRMASLLLTYHLLLCVLRRLFSSAYYLLRNTALRLTTDYLILTTDYWQLATDY